MSRPACATERSALITRVLPVFALLLLAASSLGCSGPAGESTFGREFQRLHGVTDPAMLSVVEATPESIAAAIRRDLEAAVPVLLPGYLPPEFELAAPFRGTGSGAPLPNPHTWGDGYAVTYTDGRARLTVMVAPDEPVDGGVWEETRQEFQGRSLLAQVRDGLVLVSTGPDGGVPVVVIGERVDRAAVLAVAAGLRDPGGE